MRSFTFLVVSSTEHRFIPSPISTRSKQPSDVSFSLQSKRCHSVGLLSTKLRQKNQYDRYLSTSIEWTLLPSLSHFKQQVSNFAFGDKIYCFGGFGAQIQYLDEIEVLSNETWQVFTMRMPLPVSMTVVFYNWRVDLHLWCNSKKDRDCYLLQSGYFQRIDDLKDSDHF